MKSKLGAPVTPTVPVAPTTGAAPVQTAALPNGAAPVDPAAAGANSNLCELDPGNPNFCEAEPSSVVPDGGASAYETGSNTLTGIPQTAPDGTTTYSNLADGKTWSVTVNAAPPPDIPTENAPISGTIEPIPTDNLPLPPK